MIETYIKYVEGLPLPQEFQETLSDRKFIDKNPLFYLYYPKLFCKAFEIEEGDVELLSIAGFLFFRSVIFIDDMVDNGNSKALPLALICQEEAIKILTSIFGLNSDFWGYWNFRRKEYFYAIALEHSIGNKAIVQQEEYNTLADLKSTFGKAAIDALHVLSHQKHKEVYDKLLDSHALFSVAFQIHDDILDFAKDPKKMQFNWAYYIVSNAEKKEKDFLTLHKLLYVNGTAISLFKNAIAHNNQALNILIDLPDIQWKSVLKERIKVYSQSIFQIERYLELIVSEVSLSQKKGNTVNRKKAISTAIQFIKDKQNEDGSWREYITQAGVSNLWATAFILSFLSEGELKYHFREEISTAVQFLQKNKLDKLWGFNTTCIKDADSSHYVFISFLIHGANIDNSLITDWAVFQNENGAFSTYSNSDFLLNFLSDPDILNVDGWCAPHFCVSTTAFYFLSLLPSAPSDILAKLDCYLENQIASDGITAYWWTSPIYSIFFLTSAYTNLGRPDKVEHCLSRLSNMQNKNGSFSDGFGENNFYTGLALLCFKKSQKYNSNFSAGLNYLLKNQFTDGSWENSHALRVPDPGGITLTKNGEWPVSTQGTSVRAKEINRLFTTAVVLNAIS